MTQVIWSTKKQKWVWWIPMGCQTETKAKKTEDTWWRRGENKYSLVGMNNGEC